MSDKDDEALLEDAINRMATEVMETERRVTNGVRMLREHIHKLGVKEQMRIIEDATSRAAMQLFENNALPKDHQSTHVLIYSVASLMATLAQMSLEKGRMPTKVTLGIMLHIASSMCDNSKAPKEH